MTQYIIFTKVTLVKQFDQMQDDVIRAPDDNMSYHLFLCLSIAGWWKFDGYVDIEFHPCLRDLMTDLGDTARLAILDQTFITSHPYHKADYEQDLVSYREIQFISSSTKDTSTHWRKCS